MEQKNNDIADAHAYAGDDAGAREEASRSDAQPSVSVIITKTNRFLGSAYAREGALAGASEAPPEPHSAADKAAVDAIVAETLDVLRLNTPGLRNGIYAAEAYREAIRVTKRDQWLNGLATFAAEALDGDARLAAWEAIEQARAAGSRAATPRETSRALDQLARLRDSHQQSHAEAAE